LNFICQKVEIFEPYFTRVFGVQIYAKLQSFIIILGFDEVMPYYARSPGEFTIFITHLPQNTNF